jgi:hypothetical protein
VRHVTVNFVPPAGYSALLKHTCIAENVERLDRLGFARDASLDVVFVGDVAALPEEYLARLREHGAEVHLEGELFLRLAEEFPNVIARFGGPYGIFSFALLRWLVVDALFESEPVACYDGDVIHSLPLRLIGAALDGQTGTATSTAFAAVSARSWFESWRRNLRSLDQDLEGFWQRMAGATGFPRLPQLYRYSAEEYFAKALIECGELPQDVEPELADCWLLVQPQYLPRLYAYTRPPGQCFVPTPMVYRRAGGVDYVNDKPVAFWHLQKPFLGMLGVALARPMIGLDGTSPVLPLDFYGFSPTDEWVSLADPFLAEFPYPFDPYYDEAPTAAHPVDGAERTSLRRYRRSMSHRFGSGVENPFSLAAVCRHFFDREDLSGLFNSTAWPVPDAWTNS